MSQLGIVLVGASGTGKTEVAKILERKGKDFKLIDTHTTRPPRHEGEKGHTFVGMPPEEAEKTMREKFTIIAETMYNGHYYFCTEEQIKDVPRPILTIDPHGVKQLISRTKIPLLIVYYHADEDTRVGRMCYRLDRHVDPAGQDLVMKRIIKDREHFSKEAVNSIIGGGLDLLTNMFDKKFTTYEIYKEDFKVFTAIRERIQRFSRLIDVDETGSNYYSPLFFIAMNTSNMTLVEQFKLTDYALRDAEYQLFRKITVDLNTLMEGCK